jgi:hypothetical protein
MQSRHGSLGRHGSFEPHRLPLDKMEYTTMPSVAERVGNRPSCPQPKLPLGDQLQGHHGGEGLGGAADPVMVIGRHGLPGRRIGPARRQEL